MSPKYSTGVVFIRGENDIESNDAADGIVNGLKHTPKNERYARSSCVNGFLY